MKKSINFLKCLIPPLSFLILQFIIMGIWAVVSAVSKYLGGAAGNEAIEMIVLDSTSPQAIEKINLIFEIAAIIVFSISYYFIIYEGNGRQKHYFTKRSIPAIIILALGCEIITGIFLSMAAGFFPKLIEQYNSMLDKMGIGESMTLIMSITAIILAPVAEELTFRGLTLYYARRATDKFAVANIIQAVIFGVIHMDIIQGFYAFVLGLIFGCLVRRYNSIFASIVAHITFNICGTYLVPVIFGPEGDASLTRFAFVIISALALTWLGYEMVRMDRPVK